MESKKKVTQNGSDDGFYAPIEVEVTDSSQDFQANELRELMMGNQEGDDYVNEALATLPANIGAPYVNRTFNEIAEEIESDDSRTAHEVYRLQIEAEKKLTQEHEALVEMYNAIYGAEGNRLAAIAWSAIHPKKSIERPARVKRERPVSERNEEGGWTFAELSARYAKVDRDIQNGYAKLLSDMQHRSACLDRMNNLIVAQAENAREQRWVLEDMIRRENETRTMHNG